MIGTSNQDKNNIGSFAAINFYCSSKKNLSLVKARKEYGSSIKNLSRDSTE